MRAVTTVGERVLIGCDIPWLSRLLADAAAGELSEADGPGETVRLQVQADRRPFDRDGWALVGRGAWAAPPRALLEDACSSGFDLQVDPRGSVLHVTARYRPAPRTRAANMLLGSRFRLLAAQTLLHYPALWWASVHRPGAASRVGDRWRGRRDHDRRARRGREVDHAVGRAQPG
jgi:hypothetical protein